MATYRFETLDVFTDVRFGGNPLAVFTDARGLDTAQMQALAAEMNLSETTFILPPEEPGHTARVRIFNRTAEMPFAGHPSLGTAVVLARTRGGAEPVVLGLNAGETRVEMAVDANGQVVGGDVAAPQPLSLGPELDPAAIAACAGLAPNEVPTAAHAPVAASMGNPFVIAEVAAEAISRAAPDLPAFRRAIAPHPAFNGRLSLLIYSRAGDQVRARMFAPLAGTWEDPATGSANAPLAGLLLSLSGEESARFEVTQGVEMGRPSRLRLSARRAPDGIRATVGGACVPMFRGEVSL
ncbi:PhzF family phenazine biosynthesis protein [Phenylobacterium soli]|uniref:PhzF family phenazine biosynthesis protein n=1 Tax=Phenylobacterium soli TaxID=2170551 RepID=A0A328ALA0_9CAUL|nr:PhzF family phenazine biosynthesis protein [Phenylobacterium soli]RAK55165.1 PhzF family phenazine biosynthesis protein [Phenylobacterium soli]